MTQINDFIIKIIKCEDIFSAKQIIKELQQSNNKVNPRGQNEHSRTI